MIPEDERYDTIYWTEIAPEDLDRQLEGCKITGADIVTDGEKETGLLLYLVDRSGCDFVLNAEAEIFPDSWHFYVMRGEIAE